MGGSSSKSGGIPMPPPPPANATPVTSNLSNNIYDSQPLAANTTPNIRPLSTSSTPARSNIPNNILNSQPLAANTSPNIRPLSTSSTPATSNIPNNILNSRPLAANTSPNIRPLSTSSTPATSNIPNNILNSRPLAANTTPNIRPLSTSSTPATTNIPNNILNSRPLAANTTPNIRPLSTSSTPATSNIPNNILKSQPLGADEIFYARCTGYHSPFIECPENIDDEAIQPKTSHNVELQCTEPISRERKTCPVGVYLNNCIGEVYELNEHIVNAHPNNLIYKVRTENVAKDIFKLSNFRDIQIIYHETCMFAFYIRIIESLFYVAVQLVGLEAEAEEWGYRVDIYKTNGKTGKLEKTISIAERCTPNSSDIIEIFESGNCGVIPVHVLKNYSNPRKGLTFTINIFKCRQKTTTNNYTGRHAIRRNQRQ